LNNIKAIRLKKEMMQKDLALAVGVSAPFIHDIENGHRNAKPSTMRKIAEALGCTVEDLRGGNDDGQTAQCG